jgi:hypothetical protein
VELIFTSTLLSAYDLICCIWEHTYRVKVKVKFTLKLAPKTQRGSRLSPCSFFNLGARWESVVSAMPRPLYRRERPGIHCGGGWVGPRAGLNLTYRDVCHFQRRILHFIYVISKVSDNLHEAVLLRILSGRPSVLRILMVFPSLSSRPVVGPIVK